MQQATAPFGVEFGSDLERYNVLQSLGQDRYLIDPPRPHPAFVTYAVKSTPRFGVVWVKGVGAEVDNDSYGFGVRKVIEDVTAQLVKRYGSPTIFDFIAHDGIWTEDREWVMSITQNERHFSRVWEHDKMLLPPDLHSVYLAAGADGSFLSWAVLEYASRSLAAADAAIQEDLSELL